MNFYIYRADVYCEGCGIDIHASILSSANLPNISETGDSEDYPQGPYDSSLESADTPQHCGHCGVFLENKLTNDGYNYVLDAIGQSDLNYIRGSGKPVEEWLDYYGSDSFTVALDGSKTTIKEYFGWED